MTRKAILLLIIFLSVSSCSSEQKLNTTKTHQSVSELESYLIPPIGTDRKDVEDYFGYQYELVELRRDEDDQVVSYTLFSPNHLEIMYEKDKVIKVGFHYKINVSDYSSDSQVDLGRAKFNKPKQTDRWLRAGYLHYIESRMILHDIQSPKWQNN